MGVDENELREKIRKNLRELDSSLSDSRSPDAITSEHEVKIRAMTERIVAEETEQYFADQGLVKYESTTGRVYWLTPEQKERRIQRRKKKRYKRQRKEIAAIDKKKALAMFFFMVAVVLLVWILFKTGIFTVGN